MNAALLLIAMSALAQQEPSPTLVILPDRPPPPRRRSGGPLDVACPRCKAAPGKDCDRQTLGAHRFHGARVKAAAGGALAASRLETR